MAFNVLSTVGSIAVNATKRIVVQRVHVTGGRVDEIRLEGREFTKDDKYSGPTKNALAFTSPDQAIQFAEFLLSEAKVWKKEIEVASKPAVKARTATRSTPARKTASRSAASRRKATA